MMPSIALPTGPYDWKPEQLPRSALEARLAAFRAAMTAAGATHAIVHGNGFDHGALHWLTHFTPKLGPAYALIPRIGAPRLLFAGGPGMKPSAQKLTWVEDVMALRGIDADAKRWLSESPSSETLGLGLVEGGAMLRGDWNAVQRAAGGATVALDAAIDALREKPDPWTERFTAKADELAQFAKATLARAHHHTTDIRITLLDVERAVYAEGAEDIRWRVARRTNGPATTLPDSPLPIAGPTPVVVAVRYEGVWAERSFSLT